MHVDEFIDRFGTGKPEEDYAAWVLNHYRLPAVLKARFEPFMAKHKLFCTYKGTRYQVTGASRLGDVWLSKDFGDDAKYDLRVDIAECSGWSNTAALTTKPRGSADSTLDMQAVTDDEPAKCQCEYDDAFNCGAPDCHRPKR